jgi:hypothetical protein
VHPRSCTRPYGPPCRRAALGRLTP